VPAIERLRQLVEFFHARTSQKGFHQSNELGDFSNFGRERFPSEFASHLQFHNVWQRAVPVPHLISIALFSRAVLLLLLNLNQFCAMRRDSEFEFPRKFAEVLLTPEVADEKFAGELEVGPVGGDGSVGFAEVE